MKKLALVGLSLLISTSNFAAQKSKDITLEDIIKSSTKSAPMTKSGQVIAEAEEIIAFGQKLYDLVAKGKPVFDISEVEPVMVLPKVNGIAVDAFEMDSWGEPVYKEFDLSIVKKYQWNPGVDDIEQYKKVNLKFGMVFSPKGKFEGKGNYISGLLVFPKVVEPGFAMDVDADVQVVNATNVGSALEPMASVTVRIRVKAKHKLLGHNVEASYLYQVLGDGSVREIGVN